MIKHWTIQSYVESIARLKEKRARALIHVALLITAGAMFAIACAISYPTRDKPKAKASTEVLNARFSSGFWFSGDSKSLSDDFVKSVGISEWRAALPAARKAWEIALPDYPIPNPKIVAGICQLTSTLACVDELHNTITVSFSPATMTRSDRHTILMHELGHLLGVPHIEGDPLMNAVHERNVSAPTPWAVALARFHGIEAIR